MASIHMIAFVFVIPETGLNADHPVSLSKWVMDSFEAGDQRKMQWIDTAFVGGADTFYYPYKYKVAEANAPLTEYFSVFRLSEQYLIRSEAEVKLGELDNATSDLNVVRNRAGIGNSSASTDAELLASIMNERKVELFTEWGHRWLDLKRTNAVDEIMSVVVPEKGGSWQSTDQLYPIPF